MSSTYRKINYVEEGAYGSTIKRTLFAQFNSTTDSVKIVDDKENVILWYTECGFGDELDLGQAIVNLLTTEQESCTKEEILGYFK
jgi:hypothetical protein